MNDTWQGGGQAAGPQLSFPTVTPVVKKLLFLNFAVFIATFLLSMSTDVERFLFDYLALRPSQWFVGAPWLPLWQPITSGFMHSLNDPMHILGNMLWLYFFGTMLEGILGSRRFLVAYLGSMLAGAAGHLVFQSFSDPSVGAVGASGAVMGVVIITAMLRPNTRVIFLFIPVTLKWIAIIKVGLDVFGLLSSLRGAHSVVAHWAHLGGAAFGFLAVRKGWIWQDPIQDWRIKQEQRRRAQMQSEDLRMDDLLAKIHKEGMNSLSSRERAFLKKVSNRS